MSALRFFSMLVLGLVAATDANAVNGRAQVACEGGKHVVSVSGWYLEEYDGPIEGIVFQREAIGICEDAQYVPEEPLPFEPQPEYSDFYTFVAEVTVDVPSSGVTYKYTPFAVRPDGSFERMTYLCDNDSRSWGLSSCGEAPIARGHFELSFECINPPCVEILLCAEDCWSLPVEASLAAVDAAIDRPLGELTGQVVDVFGGRTGCSMPGGDYYYLTRVELAPSGACGPVPVQDLGWGQLKAMYD